MMRRSISRRPRTSAAALVAGAAATTVTLAATAAGAQVAVLSSTVQEREAAPGERYTGTIRVLNTTVDPQAVRVYQTDYAFDAHGSTWFEAAGTAPRSNARWLAVGAAHVVVPAGTEATLTYVVTVPTADTLRGSYWSTVMVEGVPPDGQPANDPASGVGVGSVIRYAIQVATHVGAGARTVRFSDVALQAADTVNALELIVANAGERAYRPALWAEVYDEAGALRARRRQERGLLYPGTSLRQRFELGPLAAGGYKAVVFADTGGDAVQAATFKLRR